MRSLSTSFSLSLSLFPYHPIFRHRKLPIWRNFYKLRKWYAFEPIDLFISFVYVVHYLFFSWRLNGIDVSLPKIYKRDIIAVFFFFYRNRNKRIAARMNESTVDRETVRLSFFYTFERSRVCPFDSPLSWEISQTSHAICGPRWGNLDLSSNVIAKGNIYNRGLLADNRVKIPIGSPMFPFARTFSSSLPKFRARIEIEARSPDDRNIPENVQ